MTRPEPSIDDRLRAGPPRATLEEARALASIESRLFGRTPKTISLSRYVLLGRLGRGGVGMVYRAYDPELDRKVAIKLLLARRGRRDREIALLREAQAMARLSHPNVIAVYDVGTYREGDLGLEPGADASALEIPASGVFVVMELVEGEDLHTWLRDGERSWRDVVAKLIEAGRGLAAAHEAGLVHRDFKPNNVRVGVDGRVCVLDFGLAQPFSGPASSPSGDEHEVTRSAIAGTPLYMSPEQHRSERADARSDQYSFGVTLYEALAARPPFSGDLEALRAAKQRDDPPPLPDELRIPSRLWLTIKRTLAREPADRFASMTIVLDELEAILARPRRRRVALLGGAALTLAIAASLIGREAEDPCSGGEEKIAQVWNADSRARVEARLQQSGASYASTTWQEVHRELDEYTQVWARQHRRACEATHLRHEQSEAMLDLRMACLDRHLSELEAVVEMLAEADAQVVEHAVVVVNALGWLGSCEDLDGLRTRVNRPQDRDTRERVDAGYARLARAKANETAGRYDEALAIAKEVGASGRELDYLPLAAAANLRRAVALEGRGDFAAAERALLESLWDAEASREELVAADAWIRLVWIVGVEQKRLEEGEQWLHFAEAALARLGHDKLRAATLDHNRAGLYAAQQRPQQAVEAYEHALAVQTQLLGESDPAVARTLNHIANALIDLERFEEAYAYSARSLEIRQTTLGEDHPLVASCYNNMAVERRHQGREAEAETLVDAALRIVAGTGTYTEYVSRAIARDMYRDLGRVEEEREQLEHLLEIPERRLPSYAKHAVFRARLAELERFAAERAEKKQGTTPEPAATPKPQP